MGKLNCALKTNENYFPPKLKASKLAEAPLTGSGIKDKENLKTKTKKTKTKTKT